MGSRPFRLHCLARSALGVPVAFWSIWAVAPSGLAAVGRDGCGNSGRPKGSGEKRDIIRAYACEHPDANHSEIAKALGVSRPTVIKWLRDWKRDTDGLPDGAWYENGHVHVDMTEPKAD